TSRTVPYFVARQHWRKRWASPRRFSAHRVQQRREPHRGLRAHMDTTFDVLHTPSNDAKRHLHRTFWSPQRPPDTIWSWASASSAPRSGEPSTMEATDREHLPLAAVLLVTASFNHTAVVFCTVPSSCIMLCSMHG